MIRKSNLKDITTIISIYEKARKYMAECGIDQWQNGYPAESDVLNDIDTGISYVLEDENGIYGTFVLVAGEDPTYVRIEDGEWMDSSEYFAIHRVASDGSHRGVFTELSDFAKIKCRHLRVDTHRDNMNMQRAVKSNGFRYCGVIHLPDGSPRIAFEFTDKIGVKV